MIVAGPEGFRKNQYRKFNIRSESLTPGDDFGMMREVLTRRFKRLMAEAPRGVSEEVTSEPRAPVTSPLEGEVDREAVGRGGVGDSFERVTLTPLPIPPPQGAREETVVSASNSHLLDDAEESDSRWPDLVFIDGGQGQLTAARETLAELGVTDVPLIGIAKGPERDAGRETFFMEGREPFRLRPRDPVLYFVERLRDEAHRFAVGSHRQKRRKDIREAGLQEIPGIGPTRKRALLRHFGTLKAIERASVADLEHVPGINVETARKIYDFFHETAPRTPS
jgi:excinuclease ABC subunit C